MFKIQRKCKISLGSFLKQKVCQIGFARGGESANPCFQRVGSGLVCERHIWAVCCLLPKLTPGDKFCHLRPTFYLILVGIK